MTGQEIVVAIAQVAAGGTIVQGLVAFMRRRSELRKIDRESESVAVETADRVLVMLRTELETARADRIRVEKESAEQRAAAQQERRQLRDQIAHLTAEVSRLSGELATARREIARMRGDSTDTPGDGG